MKKLFFLFLFAPAFVVNAQNTFPPTGNVGIGTVTPTANLEVMGTLKSNQAIFNSAQANGRSFPSYHDRNDECVALAAGSVVGSGVGYNNTRMLNFYDFPQSNLDNKPWLQFGIEDRDDFGRYRLIAITGGLTHMSVLDKTQVEVMSVDDDGNNKTVLSLPKPNSFLTIGTNSYKDNGVEYKINANGKIRAHEVKVYTDWADFVFEADYNLLSLEEVERFIKTNGHLKDIPSAQEVEQNGVELGQMNKLLLQKIEELTLYTIQLKKEIDFLKDKIN